MTIQEKKAREMISNLTLPQLLEEWELTTTQPYSQELATVRGWLMDELEERHPEAFNKWLDSEWPEDSELKKYIEEELSK